MSNTFGESFSNWVNATGDVISTAATNTSAAIADLGKDAERADHIKVIMEIKGCDEETATKLYDAYIEKKTAEEPGSITKNSLDPV